MTVETVQMPRLPMRSVGAENLAARRIEWERSRRGWSREELARRVSEAGSPLNQSAVQKIERGTPRRTISLDEALALAEVFGYGESIETLWSVPEEVTGAELAGFVDQVGRIESVLTEVHGAVLHLLDGILTVRADAQPMFDYIGEGSAPSWPVITELQDKLSTLADLTLKVRDDLGKLAFTEPAGDDS